MSVHPQRKATSIPPPGTIEIDHTHLAALGFTPREREVMRWLIEGKRDREIAIILGLSARTVEKHVGHIFQKLNVETRTAAACQCRYCVALSAQASPLMTPRAGPAGRNAPPRSH